MLSQSVREEGTGKVVPIAPGTLCPGHIHVPGAHYTISLVKECRFVVKGCRFASVREKCMCYIWVGSSSIWELGKKEDKKEDHFWRGHLPHRASRAPSQHVRALARMSDDIGPLRPAGEHKVFHDRHGHVAGAMSAQAAFAAPWASATVPAETHAQDHGWRHFPAGFFPSSLERQGHCGAQHTSQMPQLHQVPLRPAPPMPQMSQTQTPHTAFKLP